MSPKSGRPKSDNAKTTMLRVRIDDDVLKKLEETSVKMQISKSEVVRNGIEEQYNKLKK